MPAAHRAEAHTLGMGEKFTQIPLLNTITDVQVKDVVTDLKRYVIELRAIPNQGSKFQICNSEGGGILDWCIPDSRSEELRFRTESDFHDNND
ncbi:hypothetical protein NUU61_007373 [Penicillium alfredii]|uniref:Uncharacterized protein n=1 Tax=Penicillium alfredii TaxID=1506179 RepID=A0A9W9K471_9EURO|nr:uncharacterized protein NUU61_007373 [Penicillium alfredii]KAJ5092503.1 hypothetical protein NUU61_007373 [Penicillium alfredii]